MDLGTYLHLTRQKLPYLAFSDVFQVMIDARDTDGNWIYAFRNLIDGNGPVLILKMARRETVWVLITKGAVDC